MNTKKEFWINDKDAKCWSCDELSSILSIRNNDGFCPKCDQEIDLSDEPYTEKYADQATCDSYEDDK